MTPMLSSRFDKLEVILNDFCEVISFLSSLRWSLFFFWLYENFVFEYGSRPADLSSTLEID